MTMEMAAKGELLTGVLHHHSKTVVANCVPEQVSMYCIYDVLFPTLFYTGQLIYQKVMHLHKTIFLSFYLKFFIFEQS